MNKKREARLVQLLNDAQKYAKARDQFVDCILHHQIDEQFYRKYVDLIPWDSVSLCQEELSQEFIREMKDYLHWNMFGMWGHYPVYSYDFIRQMKDYLQIEKIIETANKQRNDIGVKLKKEFIHNN